METAHVKDRQRKHWDAVAAGWASWFDWTELNFAPLTAWLRDAAPWRAGSRVLDVACGAGYPALAAAREVQPGARVVATDLSRQMLDVAAERARAEGLHHIEFVERDGEDLQFHDGSFDAVTNAYGLMFCPEPLRAIGEARRVLVPGGGIALVTWDLPSHSPFFAAFLGVAAGFFRLRDPGPDEPNPFRLASADVLRSMLDQTGFSSIDIERLPMTFECDSAFDYCRIFMDYGWQSRIAALPPEERDRFYEAVAEATRPYADEERLRLAASSLCACARK
jgi:ubiquinone/menaquinone biosynthesis C-methylase UbiE